MDLSPRPFPAPASFRSLRLSTGGLRFRIDVGLMQIDAHFRLLRGGRARVIYRFVYGFRALRCYLRLNTSVALVHRRAVLILRGDLIYVIIAAFRSELSNL